MRNIRPTGGPNSHKSNGPETPGLLSPPKLHVGDHACSFYQDDRQQWSLALALLRSSLDHGAQCLVIVDPAHVPRVEKLIADYGMRNYLLFP